MDKKLLSSQLPTPSRKRSGATKLLSSLPHPPTPKKATHVANKCVEFGEVLRRSVTCKYDTDEQVNVKVGKLQFKFTNQLLGAP